MKTSSQVESTAQHDLWPQPRPLPNLLPPVAPFDSAMLPDAVRPFVEDVAERMQCPIDFPAVSVMVVLAGVVGRKVAVRPKQRDDWTVIPNLWGLAVGRPGLMKTPAINEPMKFLKRLEIEAKAAYEADRKDYLAAEMVAKATRQNAEQTLKKALKVAAQFFRHAYRKGFIDKNPFEGVAVGKATNDDRRVFESREVTQRVLDKCPDWQWRLVFALARYGGLRCPSEIALLKWSDIHWDAERFTVTSPKTKRYGKATRVVPIFPELRPFLDEAYFRDDADKTWVVPMLAGNADKNLGTRLRKIIRRAGVEVWPKPFQNCRSSRQTELEQQFPTYVVCAWLGNTPTVAHKHYLTVTDDHFTSAAKAGDKLGTQTPAGTRIESQKKIRIVHKVQQDATFSEVVGILENARVAEEGFEPPTRGL